MNLNRYNIFVYEKQKNGKTYIGIWDNAIHDYVGGKFGKNMKYWFFDSSSDYHLDGDNCDEILWACDVLNDEENLYLEEIHDI